MRKNDTGDVLCIADNKIPSAVSHKFELTIHCKSNKFHIRMISDKNIFDHHFIRLYILSEYYPPLKAKPFISDKPRISIDISEFKHSYGGFMKIMCRIDAVPRPTQLEMRVGGNKFFTEVILGLKFQLMHRLNVH